MCIGKEGDFHKLGMYESTQGLPYDIFSVMHPSQYYLGVCQRKTIFPLVHGRILQLGSSFPTFRDILHVNILYCQGKNHSFCNSHLFIAKKHNFVLVNFVHISYMYIYKHYIYPQVHAMLAGSFYLPDLINDFRSVSMNTSYSIYI